MNYLQIELLNPKAEKLLKELEALKLIAIKKTKKNSFSQVLKKLRSNIAAPTLQDITKEVEKVRVQKNPNMVGMA